MDVGSYPRNSGAEKYPRNFSLAGDIISKRNIYLLRRCFREEYLQRMRIFSGVLGVEKFEKKNEFAHVSM